jgi:hypothetical protein
MKELNQIKIQLKSGNTREKELAYEQIRMILDRPKDNQEVSRILKMIFKRIFFYRLNNRLQKSMI